LYRKRYYFRQGDVNKFPWTNDKGLNEARGKPWKQIDINKKNIYYLHTFSYFQPDLNWNNLKVRQEMIDIANYWIDEGVDGFRFDAITLIAKDENKHLTEVNHDNFKSWLGRYKKETWQKKRGDDFFTVGELAQSEINDNTKQVVADGKGLFTTFYLPVNFLYILNGIDSRDVLEKSVVSRGREHFPYAVQPINYHFKRFVREHYQINEHDAKFPPALIMENHDHPRSVSRFTSGSVDNLFPKSGVVDANFKLTYLDEIPNNDIKKYVLPRAKPLALFKFLQSGIPIIFNGEEIGMDNNPNYTAQTYEDPKRLASIDLQSNWAMTSLPDVTDRKRGLAYQSTSGVGRDNVRTPMQWNSSVNAGWNEKFVFWDSPDHEPEVRHIYDRNLKYFQADYFRGWVDEVVEPGMDSWRKFLINIEESRSSFL
jgi:glycosidase